MNNKFDTQDEMCSLQSKAVQSAFKEEAALEMRPQSSTKFAKMGLEVLV